MEAIAFPCPPSRHPGRGRHGRRVPRGAGLTARIVPAPRSSRGPTDRIDEGVHHREFPANRHTGDRRGSPLLSAAALRWPSGGSPPSGPSRPMPPINCGTPLTALLMRLEEISSTENLDVVAESAIAPVERLSSVVDDLLARSRSGADRPPSVSLDSVLAALQREWQPTYAVRRRAIHITGARGLRVLGRRDRCHRSSHVAGELLGSRGGDGDRGGPTVRAERDRRGARRRCRHRPGAGAIFERSVSSRGSGLGLGLARPRLRPGGRLRTRVGQRRGVCALPLGCGGLTAAALIAVSGGRRPWVPDRRPTACSARRWVRRRRRNVGRPRTAAGCPGRCRGTWRCCPRSGSAGPAHSG